jgi:hypothetical protein
MAEELDGYSGRYKPDLKFEDFSEVRPMVARAGREV